MRSPIGWYGAKSHMVHKLLPLLPPHKIYVEVFGGGASLLFAKEPSQVEVYNDMDSGLVNFFRVLRDPEKFEQLYRKVCLTPYSREEYYYCRDTWKCMEDEVERAYRWYIVARGSFSGRFEGGWGFGVTESHRNMAAICSGWLQVIDALPEIHSRIMRVQIENRDFRKIIRLYDTPDTLFYLDPPYVLEARHDPNARYAHEMTLDDHKELVQLLLQIQGKALLSGYQHEVYAPLEQSGWVRHDFPTVCSAAGRTRATGLLGKGALLKKQPRVESVWVSPNAQRRQQLRLW